MTSSKRGFTLIEILVALTLLSVVATLVASGTRLTLDISRRGTKRAEAVRTQQIERNLLRAQLQGALPYHYFTEELERTVDHTAFEGTADHIRFVSRTGVTDGPEGLPRWVELRTEQSASGAATVLEERRILSPNNQPSSDVLAKALIADCSGMKFEYWEGGEKPQWRSAWPVASSPLPFAVRVQCMTASGSMKFLIRLDYAESALSGMSLR